MPAGGHVFQPIKIIWTTLVEPKRVTQGSFVPNYFEIWPVVFDKIFLMFFFLLPLQPEFYMEMLFEASCWLTTDIIGSQ